MTYFKMSPFMCTNFEIYRISKCVCCNCAPQLSRPSRADIILLLIEVNNSKVATLHKDAQNFRDFIKYSTNRKMLK